MARKIVLDVDPGIDDAVAMCIALFDPRLEVVAVTATGGNVPPEQARRNIQAIIEQLDPPRLPRIGAGRAVHQCPPTVDRHLFGSDGLGNANFEVAEHHHRHLAEKVICDEVRTAPEDVTIVALGPLTNLARALLRDPELPGLVGSLVMMGGTVTYPGNVTPAAEFNMYCDPASAQAVFQSRMTKTLIPLDVTSQILLTFDLLDQLPKESTKAGRFLRKILSFAFRSYRRELGLEGIYLHDTVALVAAMHPELFDTVEMAGDVETSGELTSGATVFDRRGLPQWRTNMDVATGVDVTATIDCIIRGLAAAGQAG